MFTSCIDNAIALINVYISRATIDDALQACTFARAYSRCAQYTSHSIHNKPQNLLIPLASSQSTNES